MSRTTRPADDATKTTGLGPKSGHQEIRPLLVSLASCDELRGGIDAGQKKDYDPFISFIK
jgi:hypothetical protein